MELSIITINRNNGPGLDETIQSVRTQSFQDFEYIIVDGDSTDDSLDVIKRHEKAGMRICWVSEKDSGIFDAMNKGIRQASGTYLLFLNSGDILDSETVLEQAFQTHHSSDILIGECRVIKDGHQIWLQKPKEKYTLGSIINDSIPHQSSFIKKALFNQYGLYRDDLRIMGDWEFFLRTIILQGCTVEPLHMVVSRYDTTGVSSDPRSMELIQQEKGKVFSDLHLTNVIPDYIEHDLWFRNNEALIWASNKKGIQKTLALLYRLACRVIQFSKRQ